MSTKTRAAAWSIAVASTLTGLKVAAALLTGSVGILASLVDSGMDVLASAVNFFAVRAAERPADREHRYGHGKAESLSGLVQALVILASGVAVAVRGVDRLLDPRLLANDRLGIAVMVVSIATSLLLVRYLRRVAAATDSPALRADSAHYLTDVASGGAVLVGLVLASYARIPVADPIVSLGVAVYIGWSAVQILRQSVDVLMDHELPPDVHARIAEMIGHFGPDVKGYHNLRTRRSGSVQFVDIHLDIDRHLSFAQAHERTEMVIAGIREILPKAVVNAHSDPFPLGSDLDTDHVAARILRGGPTAADASATVTVAQPAADASYTQPSGRVPTFPVESVAEALGSIDRYVMGKELGHGGMGLVVEAYDRRLRRRVAIKIGRAEVTVDPALRSRFEDEAVVGALLEHPNVVPVYDAGMLPGDVPFFTMRRIEGHTLRRILTEQRDGRPGLDAAGARSFGRIRLLSVFLRVCHAVAYAHSRGLLHCDLKPSNIMVGDFDQVWVIDWGLYQRVQQAALEPQRATNGTEALSSEASVRGTPAFMSPEQAAGAETALDERTDVYSLGAVLYEILTLESPFRGENASDTVARVLAGPPPPPSERAPGQRIPAELEAIVLRAMARARADRYASAEDLAREIEEHLEGTRDRARREAEATRRVAEGAVALAEHQYLVAEARRHLEAARRLREDIDLRAPPEHKAPLWAAEDRAVEREVEAVRALVRIETAFQQALGFVPDHADAREGLAELYADLLAHAEARWDARRAAQYEDLLRRYDDGRRAAVLGGEATLSIETNVPARARLFRYEEKARQLVPVDERDLGETPVVGLKLRAGSHLVLLDAPGRPTVRYPVFLRRGENHAGRVRAFTEGEIGAGFIQVPAGPCIVGADDYAASGDPLDVVTVGDFFIARFPVTCAEYLAFINALARSDAVKAHLRSPRVSVNEGYYWHAAPDGMYSLPVGDPEGDRWEADWPIMGVSFDDALAYCEWLSGRDGTAYRLPTGREYEKAARGADGRKYVWGNAFDATFCKMRSSRSGAMKPEAVGAFAGDSSPYGVRDLAGGTRQWCDSSPADAPGTRCVRGGSWASDEQRSLAAFYDYSPREEVRTNFGFRLARDAPSQEPR